MINCVKTEVVDNVALESLYKLFEHDAALNTFMISEKRWSDESWILVFSQRKQIF